MKIDRQTRIQLVMQKMIFLVLFLGIIGMLAWLGNHYQLQFDVTANKRHSICEQSIRLLDKLPGEITVHAYTRDEVTGQAISEIISRYQRHKPDVTLRLLNPDIDIAEVQRDGIVMNKPFAFVIHYQGRMEQIESLSEQSISNALLRLQRASDQKVVFLSGHGEYSTTRISRQAERSYALLASRLQDMGINIDTVNPLTQGIPDNTRLLVIASPRTDYMPGEVSIIREHIEAGVNLLWLTEPGELYGLQALATAFGIQLQDGVIIDNNTELRRTLNIDNASFIPVTEYHPHAITDTLRYNTLFPTARGISPLRQDTIVDGWQATALYSSLAGSWSDSTPLDQLGSEAVSYSTMEGDIKGPITLAVALQRTRHSNDQPTGQSGSQRVVIVGDSDFLSDNYIGAGANLNLGLNIFNWMVGDDDYIDITPEPVNDIRLEFNDSTLFIIAFGFFVLIPVALIAAGFMIWRIRNRR